MRVHKWRNWGIGARLIFITVFPIALMFLSIVSYSYHLRLTEMMEELSDRGKVISATLAENSEYSVISGNLYDLNRIANSLISMDSSIHQIDIFDINRKEMLYIASGALHNAENRVFEAPIKKQQLSMNSFEDENGPHISAEKAPLVLTVKDEPVGYVRVTMSPSQMIIKQKKRFYVQLTIASLALFISILCALYLTRSLTRPLRIISRALRLIKNGDYEVQVPVTTGGEIGDLQSSINTMSESLHQSTQDLENKVLTRTRDLEISRNEALKSDAEKRKLIQKVDQVVEDERKNIAIEIHDELNATLIAARLDSQRILHLADTIPDCAVKEEIKIRAQSIINVSLTLYASARKIVRRLRPEVLEMLGLHGAVEEIVRNYDTTHPNCRFIFKSTGDFTHLENTLAITAYRLIQEALSNVVKHALATNVFVSLTLNEEEKMLHIFIADNGIGFNLETNNPGIGIIGMRERVYAFQGKMDIYSEVDGGTEITVDLPL